MNARLARHWLRNHDRAGRSWIFIAWLLLLLLCPANVTEADAIAEGAALKVTQEQPPDPRAIPRMLPRGAVVQAMAPHRKPRSTVSGSKHGVEPRASEAPGVAIGRSVRASVSPDLNYTAGHRSYSARAPPA